MCGFFVTNFLTSKAQILDNCKTLMTRGPDSHNFKSYENFNIKMQHYRLSILDEKNGTQPMEDNHGNLSIVFNGLIYNYKSLKKKLQDKFNSKFLNNSDTEVILEAYKVWGINILQKLDGMFSFVIYDKKQKKLFVARDRFGEKPIYYSISDNNFFFSSDAKAFKILSNQIRVNLH